MPETQETQICYEQQRYEHLLDTFRSFNIQLARLMLSGAVMDSYDTQSVIADAEAVAVRMCEARKEANIQPETYSLQSV